MCIEKEPAGISHEYGTKEPCCIVSHRRVIEAYIQRCASVAVMTVFMLCQASN